VRHDAQLKYNQTNLQVGISVSSSKVTLTWCTNNGGMDPRNEYLRRNGTDPTK